MANNKKKKIIDGATEVDSSYLQSVFGGDTTADLSSPEFNGHLHTGRNDVWGHAPKIDLTNHTTGRLTLQDNFVVAKSVSMYPSIIATPNNMISATLLNNSINKSNVALTVPTSPIDNITFNSVTAQVSGVIGTNAGATPNQSNITGILDGNMNMSLNSVFDSTGISSPSYPFSTPGILTSAIWYFNLPLDMDNTKPAYFSFAWMGDILTTDAYGNTRLDSTKLTTSGIPQAQTTTFRVTWQWFSPGYSIFPPAVIYDGYTPANLPGANINGNTLTRGRIPNLTVNDLPFKLINNDSSNGNQNYVNLTGLQQATGSIMVGVQVDVLNSGFVSSNQSGHLRFYQGTLTYLSKIMGSSAILFKSF